MDSTQRWFRQGLDARIEAMQAALRQFQSGNREAAAGIRMAAQALIGPAAAYGLGDLLEAAEETHRSADPLLADAAGGLLRIMIAEAAQVQRENPRVLIVGGPPEFASRLADHLAPARFECAAAATEAEARRAIEAQGAALIVLHVVLPDADGRAVLGTFRDRPNTAATPVLLLLPGGATSLRQDPLLHQADGVLEDPYTVEEVAAWIRTRLRRGHEAPKEARRDPHTGLLNRAGLREVFTRTLDTCSASGEPVAFALVAVDGAAEHAQTRGQAAIDRALQQVAAVLSDSCRATDALGRWGLFEFAAMLPGADQFGAARAVEKVMRRLRSAGVGPDGATFRVTLSAGAVTAEPCASLEATASHAGRHLFQAQAAGGNQVVTSQAPQPAAGAQLLLVLNDALTARVLNHLVQTEQWTATTCVDATEALDALNGAHAFRLVIAGETLAPFDGFELIRRLRRNPRNNRVPAVLVLDAGSAGRADEALRCGATDFTVKPIAPPAFMAHMRRLLARDFMPRPASLRVRQVLVVDPDPAALVAAAAALQQGGGFKVFLARHAEEADATLDAERPEIVLAAQALLTADAPLRARLGAGEGRPACAVVRLVPRGAAADAGADDPLVRGTLAKPLDPIRAGRQLEDLLGLPASEEQPPDAKEHLNREILRVTRGEPGA